MSNPSDNTPNDNASSPQHYPVPQSDNSNPWDTCHKLLVEEDKARCDAWRTEIQNLLLFAGLFSGVVTAFVLDSSKSLQPESTPERTNFLLAQLVSQSSGQSSQPPPPIVVTSSSKRVNVFWFLSLMLALATVLIGITAMQWLSEYQRYSGSLTKKETLAQRNMRFEGLQKWYIPQIIAGLPLLLQAALVLFFAGMIDFLISLSNRALTISVTIVMGITLLFMIMTTVLPALQHIWLEVGLCSTSVSSPCPYKSPQSWAFLRIAFCDAAHLLWSSWVIGVYSLLFIPLSLYQGFSSVGKSFLKRLYFVKQVFTWDEFECHWLHIRDIHGCERSTNTPDLRFFSRRPVSAKNRKVGFDAARGIARVVHQHVLDDNSAYAAYNCFKQLEISAVGCSFFSVPLEEAPDEDKQCRLLVSPTNSSDDQNSVAKDVRGILFLARFRQTLQVDTKHVFVKHRLSELYIRVYTFLFAGDNLHTSSKFDEVTGIPFSALPLVSSSFGSDEVFWSIGTAEKLQIVNILATFVRKVISDPPADDSDVTRFYLRIDGPLRGFMDSIHLILLDALTSPPSSPSQTTHDQPQGQTIISKFSDLIQELAAHLKTAQTGKSLLVLSIAASHLYKFSWNKVYTEWTVTCQRYPEYVRSVKAINDACSPFRETHQLKDLYSVQTVRNLIDQMLPQNPDTMV